MEQALERAEQVQRALDQSLTTIALCDKELKDIRQILNKTIETGKGANQWIETLGRQVTESQTVIATYEEKFARTIPTEGLTEDALATLSLLRDRLAHEVGIAEAALGSVPTKGIPL
jgi:chromosome segregation ATPase